MRLFVALGIVVVTLLLLAAKVTRHHRRVVPPPEPEEVESAAPPASADPRGSPRATRAWSGPTLQELLDKAQGPATIRGHARGPEGVAISVRASLTGKPERGRRIRVEDGEFEIPGLLFGRSYDLTFDGPNLRRTTLRSVTAPADDVEARLDPRPVLRGAIGVPAGGACAYEEIALRADASAASLDDFGNLDDDCRFEIPVPDGPSQMFLVATGSGPELQMPISIPPQGDPEPVCLNPPCLPVPPKEFARLRISFAGADHTDLSATLVLSGRDSSTYNCFTNGETCELEELPAGHPLNLTAESADCTPATRTIVLHADDNDVSLPCEPKRSLQAVVKDLDEDEVGVDVEVVAQ
jgi:hypothetical protein